MPFLRPVAMSKIGLVGLKDDRETILTVLHDLGVVQVEPISKAALEHFEPERVSEEGRAISDQLIRFRGLRSALPPVSPHAPRTFAGRQALLDEATTVPIDDEVGELKREEDHLITERKEVQDHLDVLARFNFYTDRLEYLTGKNALSFFGEAPVEAFEEIKAQVAGTTDSHLLESRGPEKVRFLLAVRAAQAELV
ncbi:MAG: hypothetical protein L3J96_00130, partial [Thermoplasmata archaeon]|nr:hypothetical protein [Thermoplasmata archaeon]